MQDECAPIRRIYRGGRRHHADISVVVPKTFPCRPRVLPGHKDYMKYQYHRYRHRYRHRFCRCVYARRKNEWGYISTSPVCLHFALNLARLCEQRLKLSAALVSAK